MPYYIEFDDTFNMRKKFYEESKEKAVEREKHICERCIFSLNCPDFSRDVTECPAFTEVGLD